MGHDLSHAHRAIATKPPPTRWQPHNRMRLLLVHDRSRAAPRSAQLAAPARRHLDVVDGHAHRDVAQRQAAAGPDGRRRAGGYGVARV